MKSDGQYQRVREANDAPPTGAVVEFHIVLAYADGRGHLRGLRTYHPGLDQEADGELQLPPGERPCGTVRLGEARPTYGVGADSSPTKKLKVEIDLLDANRVRQGDKAIWQFLAKAWTADLIAKFGPHDDPWRIRRWRAALRKAREEGPSS